MDANCHASSGCVAFGYVPGYLALVVVDGCVVFTQDPEEGCQDDFARSAARRIANRLGVPLKEIVLREEELSTGWSYSGLARVVSEEANGDGAARLAGTGSLPALLSASPLRSHHKRPGDCRECPEFGRRSCRHCWGRNRQREGLVL